MCFRIYTYLVCMNIRIYPRMSQVFHTVCIFFFLYCIPKIPVFSLSRLEGFSSLCYIIDSTMVYIYHYSMFFFMVLLQGCSRGTVNLFRMVNPCPQKTFPGSLDGSCRLKPCEAATEATTRCGFPTSEITWFDAVWCGFYFFGIVRYGAVRRSAVRCGFPFFRIVRCSADAILKESYGALRCGYPLKSCFLRCG